MKLNFSKPDQVFSKKLSFEFTEKLKSNLLYLLEYFNERLDEKTCKEAKTLIGGISDKHSKFWYICAINRRLCDLAVKGRGADANFYFEQLCNLKIDDISDLCIIPINNLNRIQRALFTFYSTELSYKAKNLFHPITDEEYEESKKALNSASEVIKNCTPEFYKEYKSLVNSFILYKSNELSSGTTFSLGKNIYLKSIEKFNKKSVFIGVDRIIHETAHLLLHMLSKDDPFVLNSPKDLFYSPFRPDSRPMIGIFHAQFVLCRLIRAFSSSSLRKEFEDVNIDDSLDKYKAAFEDTTAILSKHGNFTKLGQDIFDSTVFFYRNI